MAIIFTLYYAKKISLPYSMSWWAFIFPLGAFVASSHFISKLSNLSFASYLGFLLYLLLLFFWIISSFKTLEKHISSKS